MKLNADIIYEHLSGMFDATMYGTPAKELSLQRPAFYMESDSTFRNKHVYLASADHLPTRSAVEKDALIVCVGESPQVPFYARKCCVIQIKGAPDFFAVYLAIQDIYDRLDAWNNKLFELFKEDADIGGIIACSTDVFHAPILVIDSNFHIIATADAVNLRFEGRWKDDEGNLSKYSMEHFLERSALLTAYHGPMYLKIVDSNALCVNLYDRSDRYVGCLCILIPEESYTCGFDALAVYLARIVEKSIEKNPALLATEHNARKSVLKSLTDGFPIDPSRCWLIDNLDAPEGFACAVLRSADAEHPLPSTYLSSSFELSFAGSYSFPWNDSVACVLDIGALGLRAKNLRKDLDALIGPFAESLKVSAGISLGFKDLRDARLYLLQADAALRTGFLAQHEGYCVNYEDCALEEMIANSCAGAPIETLFPYELRLLMEHDENSAVSLVETLRVFLDENMNYSKVAGMLYVHRSTLVDRINKIEKSYGLDLRDPDKRLYLQIILKALEMQKKIKANAGDAGRA